MTEFIMNSNTGLNFRPVKVQKKFSGPSPPATSPPATYNAFPLIIDTWSPSVKIFCIVQKYNGAMLFSLVRCCKTLQGAGQKYKVMICVANYCGCI